MNDDLAILGILYCPQGLVPRELYAEAFFESLSEFEWTQLRREATRTGHSTHPILRCAYCKSPAFARESPRGRRHAYHFRAEGKPAECPWAEATGRHTRWVDADKFKGRQEGVLHKYLKRSLRQILELDRNVERAGVSLEKFLKGFDGKYCFPDVLAATWYGSPAAFEIQLATTQLPVIERRECFYRKNCVRLAWIVGNVDNQLERRAFKDIYMANDGQLLGVDGEVVEKALEENRPMFKLYRLLPSLSAGSPYTWKVKILSADELNWGMPGDRPKSKGPSYDVYYNELIKRDGELDRIRNKFYEALAHSDEDIARRNWNKIVEYFGGLRWEDLPMASYDAVKALGVLATIRLDRPCVETAIPIGNLPHIVNSMLLEPKERRCLTNAFEHIAKVHRPDILDWKTVREKIERNRGEAIGHGTADSRAGIVFNVLFPEGAFERLKFEGP